jgi:hypothetical protein
VRRASQVRRAVVCALQEMLAGNRLTGGSQTHYGIRVPFFSRDLRHFDLAFGYLEGHRYCCGEIGCHVGWWRALRKAVARQGVELPPSKVTIHVAVFTDPGAQFSVHGPATSFSMSSRPGANRELAMRNDRHQGEDSPDRRVDLPKDYWTLDAERLELAAYLCQEPAGREAAPDVIESVIDGIVGRHAPSSDGNLHGFLYDLERALERSPKLASHRTTVLGTPRGQPWVCANGDPRNMLAVDVDVTERVDSLQDLAQELKRIWSTCHYSYFEAACLRWTKETTTLRFVTVIDHDDFFVSGTITAAGHVYPRLVESFERRFSPLPSLGRTRAPSADLGRWIRGLGRFGREAVDRAGVAAARLALAVWQAEFPTDDRPLRAIQAHEAWIVCPCEAHAAALHAARTAAGLMGGAASDPRASASARVAAVCCMRGDAQATRAASLTSEERVRDAIKTELLPWALGEHDPLRMRHDTRDRRES